MIQKEQQIERNDMTKKQLSEGRSQYTDLINTSADYKNVSLVGLPVEHKIFGPGKIIKQDGHYFSVGFDGYEKNFVFPGAFTDGYLITENTVILGVSTKYELMLKSIESMKKEIQSLEKTIAAKA